MISSSDKWVAQTYFLICQPALQLMPRLNSVPVKRTGPKKPENNCDYHCDRRKWTPPAILKREDLLKQKPLFNYTMRKGG